MNPQRLGWLAVVLLNAVWALLLTNRSGRVLAGAGSLVAASILCSPLLPPAIAAYLQGMLQYPRNSARAARVAVPFLLPAASFFAAPAIGFVVLTGREWITLAWVLTAASAALPGANTAHQSRPVSWRVVPAATALFLAWSSVFWLTVVWQTGIGRFVLEVDRTAYKSCQWDPLATAFTIWESHPASEHLFLGWRTAESFDREEPYANHVHPYLLTMYTVVRTVRLFGGVPAYVASNATPFFYMVVLLAGTTTLLARRGLLSEQHGFIALLFLFLSYGVVITTWRFWNDMYRYTTDNVFPLLTSVLLFVYAFLLEPARPLLAVISAVALVSLSPTYAPLLAVPVLVLFNDRRPGAPSAVSRLPLVVAVSSMVAGAIVYMIPRLLIAWKGYRPQASPFLLRSGLDGDTHYFSNMVQSVFRPCPTSCCWARTPMELLFPAFVPLAFVGIASLLGRRKPFGSLGHLLLFLCAPYLFSLILFPQAVSIHPYMYDHLLLLPVVIAGMAAMLAPAVESRLEGTWLLAFLLVWSAVLMSNLIGIAQGLAAMPVRP